jgi:hypothetical protein
MGSAGTGRRPRPSAGWLLAALAVVAVLLAIVLVAPSLLYPPISSRELDRQRVTGADRIQLQTDRFKLQNDARGALLQGLAGGVLLLGAYFTWRQVQTSREQLQHNAKATEEQLRAARDQLTLAREGQITERFTRAIDQLGSGHLDVRLGGIYALERIARDSPDDRATIGEVLTAYVRGHAPWPPALEGQAAADLPMTEIPRLRIRAADVQAAMTVLGRGRFADPDPEVRRLDLADTDLRRVHLAGADLRRARLIGADLRDAYLGDANLRQARVGGADLRHTRLGRADLREVDAGHADLRGSDLRGADLRDAVLDGAVLDGADLDGAVLDGAHADGSTRWPAGFSPEAVGVIVDGQPGPEPAEPAEPARPVAWPPSPTKGLR